MLLPLVFLVSLSSRTAAQDLSQSDTIFMYNLLKDKIVVLEQKHGSQLDGLRETIEEQQEEILSLRRSQEELRSKLGECIVEIERVATHGKEAQTVSSNIIVEQKIASHDTNFVILKSRFSSMETNMRGVQATLYRQKMFRNSCHSRNNSVSLAKLQELETQFINLSKGQ